MRNIFRLHPALAIKISQRKSALKLGLLAIPVLIICVSIIYTAISDTEKRPTDEGSPNQDKLDLSIPDLQEINPEIQYSGLFEPDLNPLAPEATIPDITQDLAGEPVTKPSDGINISLDLPEFKVDIEEKGLSDQPNQTSGEWLEETVKDGDSLALIFDRMGLSAKLLYQITHSSEEAKGLTSIKPGESLKIRLDDENQLQELVYKRNAVETLRISPDGDSYKAQTETKQVEKRLGYQSGIIENSFYVSAQRAGLSDALIMNLAAIFGWDIDFALEIRNGDRFYVIYEESFLQGSRYGNGKIIAAEFVNQRKTYRAIRYEKDNGDFDYYSPDGKSMRKAFLRAPVDFRRISSRYAKERYHPVLGKKRPHRGVDYAAATGTPIKAAGDGKVIFRGKKNGYGRTVIIKHGNQYSTLYAHMSKFRSSVKNGAKVHQGQIIGYVGQSGLATGPHLHYEFRINGVHRNPLTVKLPASAPIEAKYESEFLDISKQHSAALDLLNRAMLVQTTKE